MKQYQPLALAVLALLCSVQAIWNENGIESWKPEHEVPPDSLSRFVGGYWNRCPTHPYTILAQLGRGNFGQVYAVCKSPTQELDTEFPMDPSKVKCESPAYALKFPSFPRPGSDPLQTDVKVHTALSTIQQLTPHFVQMIDHWHCPRGPIINSYLLTEIVDNQFAVPRDPSKMTQASILFHLLWGVYIGANEINFRHGDLNHITSNIMMKKAEYQRYCFTFPGADGTKQTRCVMSSDTLNAVPKWIDYGLSSLEADEQHLLDMPDEPGQIPWIDTRNIATAVWRSMVGKCGPADDPQGADLYRRLATGVVSPYEAINDPYFDVLKQNNNVKQALTSKDYVYEKTWKFPSILDQLEEKLQRSECGGQGAQGADGDGEDGDDSDDDVPMPKLGGGRRMKVDVDDLPPPSGLPRMGGGRRKLDISGLDLDFNSMNMAEVEVDAKTAAHKAALEAPQEPVTPPHKKSRMQAFGKKVRGALSTLRHMFD